MHEGQLDLPTGPKTYREVCQLMPMGVHTLTTTKEIGVVNQKRYIIQRKKRKQTPDSEEDEDWETSESEEDPYEEVDIASMSIERAL